MSNELIIPKKSLIAKIADVGSVLFSLGIVSYQYRPRYKAVDLTFRFKL